MGQPPSSDRRRNKSRKSALNSPICGSMLPERWAEVAALQLLCPGSGLTSSGSTGAPLDPEVSTAFYPWPGCLPFCPPRLSLSSAAFPPSVPATRTCQGVEAAESRTCIEVSLAGARAHMGCMGHTNGSLTPHFLLSCKNPGPLHDVFPFPPYLQPFLEREGRTPGYQGPCGEDTSVRHTQ